MDSGLETLEEYKRARENRTRMVSFRLTKDEYESVRRVTSNHSLSDVARRALMAHVSNWDLTSKTVEDHLEQIGKLLAAATPAGAYALGLLSIIVFRQGVRIPDVVLHGAMAVTSIRQAREYAAVISEFRAGVHSDADQA